MTALPLMRLSWQLVDCSFDIPEEYQFVYEKLKLASVSRLHKLERTTVLL